MADFVFDDATPASGATSPTESTDLDILIPEISEAYDEQLLTKKRACRARENTTVTLRMTMRDRDGNGADLTQYGITSSGLIANSGSSSSSATTGGSVSVRFREAALVTSTTYQVAATVLSDTEGIISCAVPTDVMGQFGIWFAEAGALETSAFCGGV